ncbi:MAG: Nif3-like dinuclear metal center hexameric protein [Christensenellales bacterium]|jgi:dinuclear metal center YbgI/SA1388 family protein
MATVKDIMDIMQAWAPLSMAEDFDNSGLMVGWQGAAVTKIAVTLDATMQACRQALESGADMIIAHHPLFFGGGRKRFIDEDDDARAALFCARHGISLYAAHTNLDKCVCGVNDALCDVLCWRAEGPLSAGRGRLYKLVVYTPKDHVRAVENALFENGAGHIGRYSHCGFSVEGAGSFMPLEGTDPFIGRQHEISRVEEVRLESVVSEAALECVVRAMKEAHPYEEVAYDVFRLEADRAEKWGLGRIAVLEKEKTLRQVALDIKEKLNAPSVRFSGDPDTRITRMALCGGSAGEYAALAKEMGADAYLTGEAKHHELLGAQSAGIPVLIAGHFETEAVIVPVIVQTLQKSLDALKCNVTVSSLKLYNPAPGAV